MSQYRVQVNNMFDLLGGENVDGDGTVKVPPPSPVKKDIIPTPVKAAQKKSKSSSSDRRANNAAQGGRRGRDSKGARGGRSGPVSTRASRNEKKSHQSNTKGNFDRKGGHGVGNWGKDADQDTTEEPPKETKEPEEKEEGAETESQEEEKEEMSYDEYLKKSKASRAKIDLPKARAAGEGVDGSEWQTYVAHQKTALVHSEQEQKLATSEKKAASNSNKKEKKSNNMVNVSDVFHVKPSGGRGGRPQRGGKPQGDRRQGGRGQGGKKQQAAAPTKEAEPTFDEGSFPALG